MMKFLLALLGLMFATYLPGQIRGTVIFPDSSTKIKIGTGYNADGTPKLHSDDPMARPNRNTIISFHPLDFKPELFETKSNVITQKEQTFIPKVLPVTVGSTVYFVNEDQFFHNVFSLTPKSRFNIGRRPPGNSYGIPIKKAGTIRLGCDIHSHMAGFVLSLDTPYFVRVNESGNFTIKELPSGKYRVEVFHPDFKKRILTIEVIEGKSMTLDINLSNKA